MHKKIQCPLCLNPKFLWIFPLSRSSIGVFSENWPKKKFTKNFYYKKNFFSTTKKFFARDLLLLFETKFCLPRYFSEVSFFLDGFLVRSSFFLLHWRGRTVCTCFSQNLWACQSWLRLLAAVNDSFYSSPKPNSSPLLS